ncbi:hypothetical protein AB9K17_23455, partial [Salmonella enterica subsp. enterica serovar Kentucky]|uniref:hypothetical protein n=1 Tax=Salmonella enterica TaxID=28901 RepID=UPI003F4C58E2
AWNMPVTCMENTCNMHGIMHGTCMKTYVKFMPVSGLYHACPVPVKRPKSLHVPVLSHETCMAHAHYALQDPAISMHEIM